MKSRRGALRPLRGVLVSMLQGQTSHLRLIYGLAWDLLSVSPNGAGKNGARTFFVSPFGYGRFRAAPFGAGKNGLRTFFVSPFGAGKNDRKVGLLYM